MIIQAFRTFLTTHGARFGKIVKNLRKLHLSTRRQANAPSGNYQTCTVTDTMVDPCKIEPSVVIIGAGIAGLSVAQRLAQCGLNKFTVLEATERPGGRVHSCWLSDVVAEMGCQWIFGACVGNPVYTLAAQEGLLKPPLRRADSSTGLFCTSDGRAVDQAVALMAYHCFGAIKSEAMKLFTVGCGKDHGSLLNYMSLRIHQELLKFPEDMRYDAARIMYGQTNRIKYLMGDDLCKVSADNFGSYIQIPGGVLSPLLKELPDCSVKFGKPVSLIRWGAVQSRGSKGVPRSVVQCCDGEEFYADYVVITVSLGVLKEHAEKMFCPALPASKMNAIKSLGYGNVDKIFLDYDKPFWVWSEGSIKFAWSPDELAHRTDWTKGLVSVEEVEGSKHVLCAFIAGPESIVMEQASDEEVAEGVTKVLRQFTGDASLPYPSTILRSKWASDPYFCGSYSYMNVDSNVGHICDLSCPIPGSCDPVPPILMFAGEATCAGHHSSVHGARLSGIREAERIVQLTKKFGGPPPKS
ncbi:peroxisomal N(1)-acetyl-spermine/spermidine oxidase-like isoform X2 [Cylas formicarius]|uniref:peroxisomal N(1)-acetyl-spermine/spermidine oxidase-like isoform X2 n=1 Tax=Cylas formicarius TaxID=197179 RepID=UPI002958C41E|nr:peroxisomal N(1)-acetyl-spermine/spermidine oxidase-like isoform X2 [Cylas formicarius]